MARPWKPLMLTSVAAALLMTGHTHASEEISYRHASLLAATCFACHGTDGRMEEGMTPLAGRPFEGLRTVLRAFRDDQVPNTTVMNRIASGYTDAEIDAIALYFSGLSADGRRN